MLIYRDVAAKHLLLSLLELPVVYLQNGKINFYDFWHKILLTNTKGWKMFFLKTCFISEIKKWFRGGFKEKKPLKE